MIGPRVKSIACTITCFAAAAMAQQVGVPAPVQRSQPQAQQQQPKDGRSSSSNPKKAKGPQLGMFTLQVSGVDVQAPFFRSHCNLDPANAQDKDLLDAILKFGGANSTVLASTIDCQGQKSVRANVKGATVELVVYQAQKEQPATAVDRKQFTRQTCEMVMRMREQTPLNATKPNEKAVELYQLGLASPNGATAVLEPTNRACYVGFAQRFDATNTLAMVIGTTVMRGRFLTITIAEFSGANLVQLRHRVGVLIESMSKANGDG